MISDDRSGQPRAEALPDITRPDVDIIAVSHWDVADPAEQRASADALMEGWARPSWPPGLTSVSCYTSTDRVANVGLLRDTRVGHDPQRAGGLRVLTYEQWSNEQAYRRFRQTHQATPIPGNTGAAATADQSPASVEYRLYRSHRNTIPHDAPQGLRCVVFVTVEFDGPDPQRQRRWIDNVLNAIEAEPKPIPGMIAAHFHTSTDGTRAINYAEWTSEQAFDEALDSGPEGVVGQTDLPQWRHVRDLPGVTNNTVARTPSTEPSTSPQPTRRMECPYPGMHNFNSCAARSGPAWG